MLTRTALMSTYSSYLNDYVLIEVPKVRLTVHRPRTQATHIVAAPCDPTAMTSTLSDAARPARTCVRTGGHRGQSTDPSTTTCA